MKLSKLYCNKENFKNIVFNIDGLNIIFGKVKDNKSSNLINHNLGKSLILSLIDFLLLKDITSTNKENHFLKVHSSLFEEYIFFLELQIDSNQYITIKRSVTSNTKIFFKLHNKRDQNFIDEHIWDISTTLNSQNPEVNSRKVLNKLLDFNVLNNFTYRQDLAFFMRNQSQYSDIFHKNKFSYSSGDKDWTAILFELLGFDSNLIIQRSKTETIIKSDQNYVKRILENIPIDCGEIDRIQSLIEIKESEKTKLQIKIDSFDFYDQDLKINNNLVENIESQIAELNTMLYKLNHDIQQIKESLEVGFSFNLHEVDEIFKEVKINFPDQLKKDYEDLINFNKSISIERNKYLSSSLDKKILMKQSLEKQLYELNNNRKDSLSILKEENSFKKFKLYQQTLITLEETINNYKNDIENIDSTNSIKKNIDSLNKKLDNFKNSIEETINHGNPIYSDIKLLFRRLSKKVIGKESILSIKINKSKNPEFKADIYDFNLDKITAEGDGHSYKKLMNVIFDLVLLIEYSESRFINFVFHDGVLESLTTEFKIKYMKLIKCLCRIYDIQIIITVIEDEIRDDLLSFIFKNDIMLELSNFSSSDRLFGFTF